MTQEEKQLLLTDLCGRLPYEMPIIPNGQVTPHKIVDIDFNKEVVIVQPINRELMGVGCLGFEDFKMILRPMSSMTEEEKEELRLEHEKDERLLLKCIIRSKQGDSSMRGKVITRFASDWCNKNHFDFRGLIPMGLAIEAPEEMYSK